MTNKLRLDVYLTKNMMVESRNKAQQLILNSSVLVNNIIINKPNFEIKNTDIVKITKDLEFVSRGGLKLQAALQKFNINLKNKIILDIGASTGGFTDCCIKNGASKVYSLDVGKDQLHHSLLENTKVINLPNTNFKKIPLIFEKINIDTIVVDVSFISLKSVFESIKPIFKQNMILICLIKPQFELNPIIISKYKGCIKLKKHHDIAIENVKYNAGLYGFKLQDIIDSPILGHKGENKEFLGLFKLI